MTNLERGALAAFEMQFRSIRNAEDAFYKLAQQKGWLKDDDLKRALFGHQHRVSSTVHNAIASIQSIREKGQK